MKKALILLLVMFLTAPAIYPQTKIYTNPKVLRSLKVDKSMPLRDVTPIPPLGNHGWNEGIIKNNEKMPHIRNQGEEEAMKGIDPVLQSKEGTMRTRAIVSNFEGVGNVNGVLPPDTQGDVGPNHYFQMINLSFAIYDKQGNLLYGPADNSTLWNGFPGPWSGTNSGDPILLYDEQADRWLATQFAIPSNSGPYYELLAISETGDPLGSWYRYAFQTDNLPDYPKLGVWPDGYYMTINNFEYDGFIGFSYNGAGVAVFERDQMLTGQTARMVYFDGFGTGDDDPYSLLPADFDGTPPPLGTPNYMVWAADDSWVGVAQDQLEVWEFSVDWTNTANSSFSYASTLHPQQFDMGMCGSRDCIPQPGTSQGLDALSSRVMYRLQYRNFGNYWTMVTNQTVDVDGTDHAGIRWYELRSADKSTWSIYQEGTYAPDGDNRWMGSIAMDSNGNIALGYSVSSNSTYPSIRFTGRTANAPLGQMSFAEDEIIAGAGSQTHSAARWGDYSMMGVDPADGETFWYTTEYVANTGSANWQTRIAGFQLEIDLINPDPVTDLAVVEQSSNGLTLQWTATGDDGSTGNAFFYDIRYSNSPINDDAAFESAQQVASTPNPQAPGTLESFMVTGLDPLTAYHFALKVIDEQGNASTISNPANGTTWDPPVITVNPTSIHHNTDTGQTVSDSIVVSNTAGAPSTLDYSVELTNNTFPPDLVNVSVIPLQRKVRDLSKDNKNENIKNSGQALRGGGGPDNFGYEWIDSNEPNGPIYEWNDISSTGTEATAWTPTGSFDPKDEGISGPYALGFDFKFYGDVKSSIYINSNGVILFGPISENIFTNDEIPNTDTPNDLIAAFWDDLDGSDAGSVYYQQDGDKFTVQFTNWPEYYGSGTYTFQVVLYSSGKIMIYYKSVSGDLTGATIGIENSTGTDGLQVVYNANYVENNLALKISAEPEWLLASIPEGTLYDGNSAAIQLQFLTDDIPNGDYSMDVVISSNDPNNPTLTVPVSMTLNAVPVELLSFSAEAVGTKIHLQWATATETNNSGFEIQRKTGASSWEKIGFVDGGGTTTERHEYRYSDDIANTSAAQFEYRLKQIDFDGTIEFSEAIEVIAAPEQFSLSQNYPNPFNPSTKIKYSVPEQSIVKIAVFNVLGEKVADLVSEVKEAGHYEAVWSASGLSSGIYIYRMTVGENGSLFRDVKRMLLLK